MSDEQCKLGETQQRGGTTSIPSSDFPADCDSDADSSIIHIPCFTPGTMIKTDLGEVPVEDICLNDRVLTRDNGFQPVVWVGARTLNHRDLADHRNLRPVKISRNALGPDQPERDMLLSPSHAVLIRGAEFCHGATEALVPVAHLAGLNGGVARQHADSVTYIHIMFARHEIIMSDGIWSESFQPNDLSAKAFDQEKQNELFKLFPEFACVEKTGTVTPFGVARRVLNAHQVKATKPL